MSAPKVIAPKHISEPVTFKGQSKIATSIAELEKTEYKHLLSGFRGFLFGGRIIANKLLSPWSIVTCRPRNK